MPELTWLGAANSRKICPQRTASLMPLAVILSLLVALFPAKAQADAENQQLAQDYAHVVSLLERQDVARAQPILECLARRGHARSQALLSSVLAASHDLVNAWAWRSIAAYADPEATGMFLDSIALEMSPQQKIDAENRAEFLRASFGAQATGLWCSANRRSDELVDWQCRRTSGAPVPGNCRTDTAVEADDGE